MNRNYIPIQLFHIPNNLLSFLILLITLSFYSCDPEAHLMDSVKNKTKDTLFIKSMDDDPSFIKTVLIDDTYYIKVLPDSTELIFHSMKVGFPGADDLYEIKQRDSIPLLRNNKIFKFVFAVKDKCEIKISGQVGDYVRIIITESDGEQYSGILKESQKEEMLDYIEGATDVETKLLKSNFAFHDIENLVREYNTWVKNRKK